MADNDRQRKDGEPLKLDVSPVTRQQVTDEEQNRNMDQQAPRWTDEIAR